MFHGRTNPPGRQAYLEDVVRLATQDEPDVVCLQEVPVWALEMLSTWSGKAALGDVTRRPLPLPTKLSRWLTDQNHGKLRSLLTGQANATLVGPRLDVLASTRLVLNDRRFRHEHARRLGLSWRVRFAWARERRVCQVIRVALPDGRTVTVLNIHATHLGTGNRIADAEILEAVAFAEVLAPGDAIVLAGDFNASTGTSSALDELVKAGYSAPGPGIDHILVRGIESSPLRVWPDERRRVNGRLRSDHPPVELYID